MNLKKISFAILLSFLFFTTYSQSEEYVHDGFFLNLALGVNFGGGNFKVNNQYDIDFSGVGAAIDVLVGGAVSENTILHATLSSMNVGNPTLDDGFQSVKTQNQFIGTGFLGAGATFYTADNFFLSPNVGRSVITVTNDDQTVSSEGGLGFVLRVGKEWWVGKQWGLGLSLSYRGASGSTDLGQGFEEEWSSRNISVSFSATLN